MAPIVRVKRTLKNRSY